MFYKTKKYVILQILILDLNIVYLKLLFLCEQSIYVIYLQSILNFIIFYITFINNYVNINLYYITIVFILYL